MNTRDLIQNLDTISLKEFVENYDTLKATLYKVQQKAKEIDGKYNFDQLPSDQISGALQDCKELINIMK